MHFVLILGVLLATTLAEKAPREAAEQPALRLLLAVAAMLLAPALAATMSALVIRGIRRDAGSWATWVARFAFGQQIHAGVWVLLVGAICYGLSWPQIVRENLGLGTWLLIDDLLILAPVYVPLLLSWAVFYDVDRAVYELTAEQDEPAPATRRGTYVLLHARHYLGLVLLPLLLVLGIYDVARWLAPDFAEGPYAWLLMTPLMIGLIVLMPRLLAMLWKTVSLPAGELRSQLEAVLQDAGLQVHDLLVWRTEGRMTNAAVSGLCPSLRYVFLTDRLLTSLEADEVAAVLRHEAGHIVRHHLLLRMLLLGLPLALWAALSQAAPQAIETLTTTLTSLGVTPYLQESLLLPGAVALYGLIALGGYCKLLEYEADLFACGLGAGANDQSAARTAPFIAALYKITAESGGDRQREGWLHPSVARRIRFVQRASQDPTRVLRFQQRLSLVAAAIAAGYLLSLCAILLSL